MHDTCQPNIVAGHVGVSARHSNQFRVSVNTEARSRVTFYLLYEELLQRKRGIYEHVINLTPRQKLKAFGIDVRSMLKKDVIFNKNSYAFFYRFKSRGIDHSKISAYPASKGMEFSSKTRLKCWMRHTSSKTPHIQAQLGSVIDPI